MNVALACVLLAYVTIVVLGLTSKIPFLRPYQFATDYLHWRLPCMALDCAALAVAVALLAQDECSNLNIFAAVLLGVIALLHTRVALNENMLARDRENNNAIWSDDEYNLLKLNALACLLHAGSSFFMAPWVRLTFRCMDVKEWTGKSTWSAVRWLTVDGTEGNCANNPCVVTSCVENAGHGVPLESLTFVFHFGSALAHLCFVLRGKTYIEDVKSNGNAYRWIEYAITAPVMIVVIMSSCGFTDVWLLTCAAMLTAITQAFGWLAEKKECADFKYHLFGIGSLCALAPWVAIMRMFAESYDDSSTPWFVPAIIFALFALFFCFAVIMYLYLSASQNLKKDDHTFEVLRVTAERRYLLASLVSKFLLAWLLWFGAFTRSANDLQQAPNPSCTFKK